MPDSTALPPALPAPIPLVLAAREVVNPHLLRLHLHAPALAAMDDDQADDSLLLHLPATAGSAATTRTYTVRARQDDNVVIDVQQHGPGAGTAWSRTVQAEAVVHAQPLPRSGACQRAADYPHHVLLGDEAALALVGRWLERLPEGISAEVFVEVASPAARQPLAEDEDITIQWLERNDVSALDSQLLEDALTDWEAPDHVEDVDAVFFVIAGEAGRSARMARFLTEAWGVDPDAIHHAPLWQG